MDYEKKYKEAINKFKNIFIDNDDRILYKHDIESVFPELKENEDERIRKAVIEFVKQNKSFTYYKGISKDDCIAWLEKQGEQKPAWSEEDEKYYDSALWHIKNSSGIKGNIYNWLKSLRERMKGE